MPAYKLARALFALAMLFPFVPGCGPAHDVINDCRYGDCEAASARCHQGDPSICNRLGELYEQNGKRPADYGLAGRYYLEGCKVKPLPCGSAAELGMKLAYGRPGYPKDEPLAAELFQKACDGNWMRGCVELGLMRQNGRGGLPKDARAAAMLYQKACAYDGPIGYRLGDSMVYDATARPDGCQALGELYYAGEGVRQNSPLAAEMFYRAELFQAEEDRRQAQIARMERRVADSRAAERRAEAARERAAQHADLDPSVGIGGRLLLVPLIAGAIIGVPGAALAVATTQSVQAGVELANGPTTVRTGPRSGYPAAPQASPDNACAAQCDLDANRCNLACDASNPLRVTDIAASNLFLGCTTSCEVRAMDCRCKCSASLCR